MEARDMAREIHDHAISCGFDDCGIVHLDAVDGFAEMLEKRERDVPESRPFYDHLRELRETRERFPWAKSIVVLSFYFGKYRYPRELQGRYAKAFFLYPEKGNDQGFDLRHFEEWFAQRGIRAEGGERLGFPSVGPLRWLAVKAGMGGFRRNNFFYTKDGSWNTLFAYAIDHECELIRDVRIPPCPPKCDLCRRACKTHALSAPYTMNPLKCVSFLTTFGNSGVPEGLDADMFQEWVCGCDNCQDACPYNRRHDWNVGEDFSNLEEIAPMILPGEYGHLSDEFLIREVVARTDGHVRPSQVESLRKNAERALNYRHKHGSQE